MHGAGALQPLLVAQLDSAQVQHGVLHGGQYFLTAPAGVALVQGGYDAQGQVQAGAAVANLRTCDHGRPFISASGRGRAPGALGHVFIDFAVFIGARAESLDGSHDHARVDGLDVLPGDAHAVHGARREIFDQHITSFDQLVQNLFALGFFGIQSDGALVVVEHGEVQTVHTGNVAQLTTGCIAFAGAFDLDDVCTKPGQ